MKFSILVKTENYEEFLLKKQDKIEQLKLLINTERRKATLVILSSTKKKEVAKTIQELDFQETISKLVNLGYFSDINPVSTILSDKQFLCFYLHYILGFKSEEIANFTHNSSSTIRDHLSNARKRIFVFNKKLKKMNLEYTILNNLSAIPFESLKSLTFNMTISIEDIRKIVSLNPFFKIMIRDSKESPFKLYTSINSLPEEKGLFLLLPLTNMFEKVIYLEKK